MSRWQWLLLTLMSDGATLRTEPDEYVGVMLAEAPMACRPSWSTVAACDRRGWITRPPGARRWRITLMGQRALRIHGH